MQFVLLALSSVCAVVPMVLFLVVIWLLDRHDREPVWLVLLTFLWGGIGAVLLALIGNMGLDALLGFLISLTFPLVGLDPAPWLSAVGPVVVAPLVEEPAKAIFLAFVLFNRRLETPSDGFIYGAAAGLGFGMTENFLYFSNVTGDPYNWMRIVIIRTLYSAVMHGTCTSLVGAFLSWGRFRGRIVGTASLLAGLGVAMTIHAGWNGLLTIDELLPEVDLFTLNLMLLPVEVLIALCLWQATLFGEGWLVFRELRNEAAAGTLPADHARIVSSWWRRLLPGWLPEGVDARLYVRSATTLAIRREQLRRLGHDAPTFYRDDAARLRRQLKRLLAAAPNAPSAS